MYGKTNFINARANVTPIPKFVNLFDRLSVAFEFSSSDILNEFIIEA